MISKATVIKFANERIEELGIPLFIVECKISSSNKITLELDKKDGSVSIDECVSVSRNIEHNLDREEADFELSVSSAGLDKPLRVFDQYPKNIGRQLECLMKKGETITGTLTEVDKKGLTLENEVKKLIEGKKKKETVIETATVAFSDIKEARIIISFK